MTRLFQEQYNYFINLCFMISFTCLVKTISTRFGTKWAQVVNSFYVLTYNLNTNTKNKLCALSNLKIQRTVEILFKMFVNKRWRVGPWSTCVLNERKPFTSRYVNNIYYQIHDAVHPCDYQLYIFSNISSPQTFISQGNAVI